MKDGRGSSRIGDSRMDRGEDSGKDKTRIKSHRCSVQYFAHRRQNILVAFVERIHLVQNQNIRALHL